jgi:hypothetical protein
MESVSNKLDHRGKEQMPLMIRVRRLILGTEKADAVTQLTFFLNLFFWILFIIWSVASLVAFSQLELIISAKEIPVTDIIDRRGLELGFEPGTFIGSLMIFQYMRFICWVTFFIGLILLYRKQKTFIYFTVLPVMVILGSTFILLGYEYFKADVSNFDKIALLIMLVSCTVFYFLLKRDDGESDGAMHFFGVEDTE